VDSKLQGAIGLYFHLETPSGERDAARRGVERLAKSQGLTFEQAIASYCGNESLSLAEKVASWADAYYSDPGIKEMLRKQAEEDAREERKRAKELRAATAAAAYWREQAAPFVVVENHLPADASLPVRAASINRHIDLFYKATDSANRHRIIAGRELIEARKLVPAGTWNAWCKANIKRSRQDIARVMKLADAEDPAAAHEAVNAARREETAARNTVLHAEPEADAPTVETLPPAVLATTGLWNEPDAAAGAYVTGHTINFETPEPITATQIEPVAAWIAAFEAFSSEDKRKALSSLASLKAHGEAMMIFFLADMSKKDRASFMEEAGLVWRARQPAAAPVADPVPEVRSDRDDRPQAELIGAALDGIEAVLSGRTIDGEHDVVLPDGSRRIHSGVKFGDAYVKLNIEREGEVAGNSPLASLKLRDVLDRSVKALRAAMEAGALEVDHDYHRNHFAGERSVMASAPVEDQVAWLQITSPARDFTPYGRKLKLDRRPRQLVIEPEEESGFAPGVEAHIQAEAAPRNVIKKAGAVTRLTPEEYEAASA